MASAAHGCGDDDATRASQRAAPPAQALAWLTAAAGARSVEAVEPMPGGASLAMHRVTISFADGDHARLVLRRYVRPDQLAEDSAAAAHEAAVLELVEPIATLTPRLIAVDPTGEHAGTPAVLMTELAGQPVCAANQRWMHQLVEVLVDVHAVDPAASGVRPFAMYAQESYALPKWVTNPSVWERAIEIFHGPILDDDRTFIHRDFYPGNVLWQRKMVSGLVDWEAASVGPRSIDVAHCRVNLLYQGLDTAESFTRGWEHTTGSAFHRWADIATIIATPSAATRHPSATGSTSKPCCNAPSTKSTANRSAHRTIGDQPRERTPSPASAHRPTRRFAHCRPLRCVRS
jgi:aminoglycoside phosphotransferase (APT) family kinase protein